MSDKLVTKVNAIHGGGFVLKTQYNTDKSNLEKKIDDAHRKIPNTGGFVKKADHNAKITEMEGKIPSITDLDTTAALTAVENKMYFYLIFYLIIKSKTSLLCKNIRYRI